MVAERIWRGGRHIERKREREREREGGRYRHRWSRQPRRGENRENLKRSGRRTRVRPKIDKRNMTVNQTGREKNTLLFLAVNIKHSSGNTSTKRPHLSANGFGSTAHIWIHSLLFLLIFQSGCYSRQVLKMLTDGSKKKNTNNPNDKHSACRKWIMPIFNWTKWSSNWHNHLMALMRVMRILVEGMRAGPVVLNPFKDNWTPSHFRLIQAHRRWMTSGSTGSVAPRLDQTTRWRNLTEDVLSSMHSITDCERLLLMAGATLPAAAVHLYCTVVKNKHYPRPVTGI